MKKLVILLISTCLLLTSCGNAEADNKVDKTVDKTVEEYSKLTEINNKFAYDSFKSLTEIEDSSILSGKGGTVLRGDNLIYSPYSYECAFSTLVKFTDGFDGIEKLKSINEIRPEEFRINNLKSKDVFMANSELIKGESEDPAFVKLGFPKEAEDYSKKMQNDMFGRILLEPKYEAETMSTIINVTKFQGKWSEAFNSELTKEGAFTKIDGKTIDTELMNTIFFDTNGYEDEYLKMTKKAISGEDKSGKALEEPISDMYIIVPKYGENDKIKLLKDIIANLDQYIENYDENSSIYDEVKIVMPKLDTKSTLDLSEYERQINSGVMDIVFSLNRNMTKDDDGLLWIDGITQVANLRIDEEEVVAEAITEIMVESAAMEVGEKKKLEIIADVPYLLVITSRHGENDIISFMAYINSPES